MASTQVLLLQLLLVALASASHHYGGTVGFTYKGRNPDGTFQVDLRTTSSFRGCYHHYSSYCYTGNCGYVSRNLIGVVDRNNNASSYSTGQWCDTQTVETRNVPNDRSFQMRISSCCWVRTRNSLSSWNLLTFVDLGTRSDTGQPNRSPDVAILHVLRVPQNCPRTYRLMSFDPDGDKVRCRYGNIRSVECSTCHQPPGFYIDQGSCTLYYQSASSDSNKVFGFEMVVEDFPLENVILSYSDGSRSFRAPINSTTTPWWWSTAPPPTTPPPTTSPRTQLYASTAPLSKLPLQFSVFVDPSIPSCQEGHYLPKLVAPTPQHGARIQAEVNKEVEIRVNAQAAYTTIQQIIMSGPLNISKRRTTHNEFVIRWTPTPDNLGNLFPVCFAVESVSGSRIYQSEMRCVLVDVGREHIKSNVICNESTMTVEVEKSSFAGLDEDHLRLSDPTNTTACSLQTHSNSTHVIGVIPLNACGTQIEEDEDNLIFKNEITTFDNNQNTITRHHLLEVQFYCQYPKRGNVTLGFLAHRKNITVWEKGFGTFTYNFEFFPDTQYQTMIDPNSYPLEYDLGSRIYMQIEAESSVNNTELFVESCRATPYDNPNSRPSYSIIENGCNVDSTIQTYSTTNERQFRFSMEAFKFIGLHDQVYISCSVMMCEAGNPDTRCSQGCVNSTWSSNHRAKRETVAQTLRHRISQGPLRLKRSAVRSESPVINLNLNLVFIAGCLLAAVGMVSAVVMYKAKVSRVKYQPLPAFEN